MSNSDLLSRSFTEVSKSRRVVYSCICIVLWVCPVCSGELDLIFLVDSSGSIEVEHYPFALQFVAGVVSQLDVHPDRTRVGLLYWSDVAFEHFPLVAYDNRHDVTQAVLRTPYLGGRTHTASALRLLYTSAFQPRNGDRVNANNIVIVITDGDSNVNQEDTLNQAIEARTAGIHIIVVAVGQTFVNFLELEGIASAPYYQNIYNVDRYEDLPGITDQIVAGTCNGWLILSYFIYVFIYLLFYLFIYLLIIDIIGN